MLPANQTADLSHLGKLVDFIGYVQYSIAGPTAYFL